MVPIYDTDVAEERWAKSKWDHYELWEKVESRLRRQKRLWVFLTIVVFLMISSVPIVMDRWPKWTALIASRRLAQEINWIKRFASIHHAAYQIKFQSDGNLNFTIEKRSSCSDPQPGTVIKSGALLDAKRIGSYVLLGRDRGAELGIPGLVSTFCYDYLAGSDAVLRNEPVVGFGVVPVKDLTDHRMDRLSVLLLTGPSAEISFD